jgi:hypothetical protein
MNVEETDAKITMPNIQPSKLRPEINRIRNKSDSFLMMI